MEKVQLKNYCIVCLCVIIFGLSNFSAYATTYYVSNAGNDSNSGITTALPWKTLAKVNSTTFKAGDQILFQNGSTFYGTLTVKNSGFAGSPIVYGAYGTGSNPMITGFTQVTSWTNLGANIWESTNAVSSLLTCDMVTINGVPYPKGRTPNSGWYTYQTFSTNVSITSSDLNSAVINWTGAEVVIKKAHWVIDRNPITNHSGGTLTYSGGSFYNGMANYGFFIQNDTRTLDTQDEWYYNPSSKKIRIYSTSQPVNVKVATVDNLLTATNTSYFTVNELSFIGSNQNAIYLTNSSGDQYATITNCNFDYSGRNAVAAYKSSHLTVSYCTINHTNNTAINLDPTKVVDINSAYSLISHNTIQNTGLIEGFGDNADGVFMGINSTSPNVTIENNSITNTGFNGITFMNSNVLVKNNFINYTNILKDDGAGIYTYIGKTTTIHTDRQIVGNIVMNSIGNGDGTADGKPTARGIYFDGYSNNIDVIGNTVSGCSNYGIYVDGSKDITLKNNTSYNNSDQLYLNNWGPKTTGLEIKSNIFISKNSKQRTLTFQVENTDIINFGISDSNYYASVFSDLAPFHVVNASNPYVLGKPYNLKAWQTDFNKDPNSKASPILRYEYDYTTIGGNKYANEKFPSNILGVISANCTTTWNADGGLDAGCLEISNPTLSTKPIVQFKIGAVESGKTYLVKLSSKSAKRNSMMRISLIQNTSPYSSISYKLAYLDTERIENQLLFTSSFTHSNVSMMIALTEADQKVWIDNVQVYEVSLTMINPDEYVQFAYNNTLTEKIVSLISPRMIDAKGETFDNGSIILEPFTSMVLMKVPIIAPDSPESVKAIAGDAQALVTFDAPKHNGGSAITGYTVTSIPAGGIDSNTGSTSLTHTITGLINGTSYSFTVKATNLAGTSADSAPSNSVTPIAPVATTFTFTGPSTGNVNSASANYTITPDNAYTGTITITPTGTGSIGLTARVLTFSNSSTAQTFSITPTVAGSIILTPTNSGILTNAASLTYTSNAVVPGTPTSIVAIAENASSTVTFVAPANNGGTSITGYIVTSIPAGGIDSNAGSTLLTHTITGLTNGTSYTFTVKATNIAGTSAASTPSNSVIPSAPMDIIAPIISAFLIPTSTSSLTVSISTFTASDNVGVMGYLLTETSTKPLSSAPEWSITKPSSYTFNSDGTKSLYAWAKDAAGNVSVSLSGQVVITLPSTGSNQGNTEVYNGTSTAAYRRAMPVTFSELGSIQSISIYHNGGTGNVILGVYSDQSGNPSTQLGVTSSTVINSTAGWQTVSLASAVNVTAGQTVWLAWVFQNNPGVRYMAGTPGRAQSTSTWTGEMPATFGTSTIADNKFSIYCTYTVNIISTLGNIDMYAGTSTAANQRAMPVTFSEAGSIQSISIYHNGGTGDVLLGVYSDQSGTPASQLGVTPSTIINTTAGWQTVSLAYPVKVTAGQRVWLAWVFQNNPGVRYMTGTPGRAQSTLTWTGALPATFGTSTIGGNKFSIYCTYIVNATTLKNASIPDILDFKSATPPTEKTLIFNDISDESSINILEENDFKLFPNPAKSFVYINYTILPEAGTSIEIINGNGIKIYEKVLVSLSNRIDTDQFTSGIYFIRSVNNKKLHVKKLIIQ
jgi:parallel beta-helix repeat protein